MRTTRTKVFETNSSSTHSISISNIVKEKLPDFHGETFTLNGGEFGWGYKEFTDWQIKANYAAIAIENRKDETHKEWLTDLIKEETNCGDVIFVLGLDDLRSYIDHQSSVVYWDNISSKEDLYNFIFGNSTLTIDNDNH